MHIHLLFSKEVERLLLYKNILFVFVLFIQCIKYYTVILFLEKCCSQPLFLKISSTPTNIGENILNRMYLNTLTTLQNVFVCHAQ